jgi:glycosyltransferase involved in cell wall biosynthesis
MTLVISVRKSFKIIIFQNEHLSLILVHLGQPLQDYVNDLKIVTLLRAPRREGLIRARLLGASKATGDVLIFLDSHCECADGWLEPLLDPIARNSNVSVVPLIEAIDDNTFEMHGTPIESSKLPQIIIYFIPL